MTALIAPPGKACTTCGKRKTLADFSRDRTRSDGVRGLLCNKCNAGIGMLGDRPEMLMAAMAYLQAHKN
jgi:hypothetical protein